MGLAARSTFFHIFTSIHGSRGNTSVATIGAV